MAAQSEGIKSARLGNGMVVNVVVNRSSPLAEVHLYVRTGYSWEPDELSGVSHVVEHNLMHASPLRPTREDFSRDRRAIGAWYDAGTAYDYTEYMILVPKAHLRSGMEMLADGFFSPVFTEDVFKSEMGAIIQESRRKEDLPEPMALEKLYSAAYKVHRRRRWRLGTAETLGKLRLDDLLAYFRARYGPGNIACTIGGDIDPDEAMKLAREIFGKVPAAETSGENSPPEPPQDGIRYLEIPGNLQGVYWICGFHVPPFMAGTGYHVFDLIACILGGGRGSRLNARVQDKGLVDRIEARSAEFDEFMLFNVYAETDAERVDAAAEAVLCEIFALSRRDVSAAELARAKMLAKSAVLMRKDDLRRHCEWLAVCQGRGGDVNLAEKYPRMLDSITAADIREAAANCFTLQNLSACVLRPSGADSGGEAGFRRIASAASGKAGDAAKAAGPEAPAAAGIELCSPACILTPPGDPVRQPLSNGAAAVFRPSPGNPAFALAALVRGGRFMETEENCGITNLMQACMLRGTRERNADALAAALEDAGARLEPAVSEDAFGFMLYGPCASFDRAAGILAEVMGNPAFSQAEIGREKAKLAGRIKAFADRPREFALELFRQEVFRGHPYSLPALGDPDAIGKFESPDLSAWHARLLSGTNLVVSLSADMEAGAAMDAMEGLFGALPKGRKAKPPKFDPAANIGPRFLGRETKHNQTTSVVGFPSPAARSKDLAALDLISYFCQGDGGRFYDEIRGKRGLAYVVHAVHAPLSAAGHFLGFPATAHDKAAEARGIFVREFERLGSELPDRTEFDRTKEFAVGMQQVRQRRTSLQRALAMAWAEIRGDGFEWEIDYEKKIRAVTPKAFMEAAARTFISGRRVVVAVGRAE